MSKNAAIEWAEYRAQELTHTSAWLQEHGFVLDEEQPHLSGERFLMQAVTTTSGRKLILLGTRESDGKRVVIKVTSDPGGIREIEHERLCRRVLCEIRFAYQTFLSPEELLFEKKDGRAYSVQAFIEQDRPFTARPIEEQFDLALRAFKAQESAHAATYEHTKIIERTFGSMESSEYLAMFEVFKKNIHAVCPTHTKLHTLLATAEQTLREGKQTIQQYIGFLTHTDFVPHNIRIVGSDIYLLDHSSLRFGNKYEGWARFLNFMELYNPPLTKAFLKYIRDNRAPEELQALTLMRIYRLGEIISYYASTLTKSSDELLTLNTLRIDFWTQVLEAVLANQEVPEAVVRDYQTKRDILRSPEEKKRQQNLH